MNIRQSIDWNGDGRKLQHPPENAVGKFPHPVRLWAAKMIASSFMENGESFHSNMGTTVWVIVDYCTANKLKFDLTTHFDEYGCSVGWTVKLRK